MRNRLALVAMGRSRVVHVLSGYTHPDAAGLTTRWGHCSCVADRCDDHTHGRRRQTTAETMPLVVSNDAAARRDLSSLDSQGKRVPAKSRAAGETYTRTAHAGEVWVVSDAGGACVAIQTVVAPALLILSASRVSLVPLYAIRGRVTDAQTGASLAGQSVFIWMPDESSRAIIGGSGSPGYVVSSITAPDGMFGVYVTRGDHKVRVRTAPVNGVRYEPR